MAAGRWSRSGQGRVEGGLHGGRGCATLPGRGTLGKFAFGVTRDGCGGVGASKQRGFFTHVFGDVIYEKREADCFVKYDVGICGDKYPSGRKICKGVAIFWCVNWAIQRGKVTTW